MAKERYKRKCLSICMQVIPDFDEIEFTLQITLKNHSYSSSASVNTLDRLVIWGPPHLRLWCCPLHPVTPKDPATWVSTVVQSWLFLWMGQWKCQAIDQQFFIILAISHDPWTPGQKNDNHVIYLDPSTEFHVDIHFFHISCCSYCISM